MIKENFPDIVTIAKGAHFNILAKEALESFPALDIAIRGEAELTLKDILSGKYGFMCQGVLKRLP